MHRIDTATKAVDLFGAGKHGFKAGDPSIPTPATHMSPDWCNDLQENVARTVEGAGIALVKGDGTQLLTAIQQLISAAAFGIPPLPDHVGAAGDGDELAIVVGGVHKRISVAELLQGRLGNLQQLQDQIALTNARLMLNSAVSSGTLVAGRQWELLTDEWGATSTNETWNGGPPAYYSNGGTGYTADLTGGQTYSSNDVNPANAFDDDPDTMSAGSIPNAPAGQWIEVQFATAKHIRRVTISHLGSIQTPALESVRRWDGSAFVSVHQFAPNADGSKTTVDVPESSASTRWRIYTDAALSSSGGWWVREIEMMEYLPPVAMTLVQPSAVIVPTAPTYMDLYFLWRDMVGTAALGVDVTASLSRNGATAPVAATLTNLASFDGSYSLIRARADVSGQPSAASLWSTILTTDKSQRVAPLAIYAE